jgi:hypothetical protein
MFVFEFAKIETGTFPAAMLPSIRNKRRRLNLKQKSLREEMARLLT